MPIRMIKFFNSITPVFWPHLTILLTIQVRFKKLTRFWTLTELWTPTSYAEMFGSNERLKQF